MAKGKVISSTPNGDPWTDNKGVKKYNFIIKFEGADDSGEVPERYIFVSEKETNDVFIVGKEVDYAKKLTRDNSEWKVRASVGGKTYSWPVIELPKQNSVGGFVGGGKSYSKTPDQVKNELASFVGGYAQQVLCHRINLGKDAEDIVKQYEILVDGFYKALVKHIK